MALGPAQKAELVGMIYEKFGVPAAASACNLSVKEVLEAADEDQDFADAIERAVEHLAPMAEQEMLRRAVRGVDSYVTSQGRIVFITGADGIAKPLKETKYSDALLVKFLESRNRKVFGPKVEIAHKHSGFLAVPVMSATDLQKMLTAPEDDAAFVDAEFEEVEALTPLQVSDASIDADTVPDAEASEYIFGSGDERSDHQEAEAAEFDFEDASNFDFAA